MRLCRQEVVSSRRQCRALKASRREKVRYVVLEKINVIRFSHTSCATNSIEAHHDGPIIGHTATLNYLCFEFNLLCEYNEAQPYTSALGKFPKMLYCNQNVLRTGWRNHGLPSSLVSSICTPEAEAEVDPILLASPVVAALVSPAVDGTLGFSTKTPLALVSSSAAAD